MIQLPRRDRQTQAPAAEQPDSAPTYDPMNHRPGENLRAGGPCQAVFGKYLLLEQIAQEGWLAHQLSDHVAAAFFLALFVLLSVDGGDGLSRLSTVAGQVDTAKEERLVICARAHQLVGIKLQLRTH